MEHFLAVCKALSLTLCIFVSFPCGTAAMAVTTPALVGTTVEGVLSPQYTPDCTGGWSPWLNKDSPDLGDGDHEQMSVSELASFCPGGTITEIDCRTVDDIPYYSSGEILTCTNEGGLTCNNAENFPIPCSDYKIRYECTCATGPATSVQPAASSSPPSPLKLTTTATSVVPPSHRFTDVPFDSTERQAKADKRSEGCSVIVCYVIVPAACLLALASVALLVFLCKRYKERKARRDETKENQVSPKGQEDD